MQNALSVGVVNCACHLCHQCYASSWIFLKRGLTFQQAAAGGEFHAEKRQSVFALAYFINRQNVWMIETGRSFGLTTETHQGFARVGMIGKNPFQRDDAARMPLTCAINNAHSAAPDLIEDLIIAQSPIGVAHIHFIEHAFQTIVVVSLGAEAAIEQAV